MVKSKDKAIAKRSKEASITKPARITKAQLSQERVEDSDEDSSSSDAAADSVAKHIATKAANGIDSGFSSRPGLKGPQVSGEESSSSDSEAEAEESSEADSEAGKTGKNSKITNGHAGPKDVGLDEGESSSEVSSSSEDEIPTEKSRPDGIPGSKTQPRNAPAPRFVAPAGYTRVDDYEASPSLKASDLGSKELWHITLPAGLPVSQLASIPLAALKDGQSVLSHNGTNYSVSEDPHSRSTGVSNKYLLVPDPSTKKFRNLSIPVSRTMHIKSKITLPSLAASQADGKSGSAVSAITTFKTIDKTRPQPIGLKMRYKPPGFGAGKPGMIGSESSDNEESDVEMEDAPPAALEPTFRRPTTATSAAIKGSPEKASLTPNKKRKRDAPIPTEREVPASNQETPSKDKKTKKRKSEIAEAKTGPPVAAKSTSTPAKSRSKPAVTPLNNGVNGKHNSPDDGEETPALPTKKINDDLESTPAKAPASDDEEEEATSHKKSLSKEEKAAKKARKAERAKQREEKEARRKRKAEQKSGKT
ncbi:DNA-directed RNA polymerase I subunit RPA34.5-domain-containing protein [Elsinoe ampelina]|uniref:DNA-directed RNA polymerase I subunit RPA34.5-domain-containing protein n=1 Tax=Elsinoe ampelina TaxID=302913 RepID=A0A6A6FYM5_9PEZI|nr:DNA-directed RNA polymerase I subunit RPA34.5-domain-containing protein [Elsinoe ampelina]